MRQRRSYTSGTAAARRSRSLPLVPFVLAPILHFVNSGGAPVVVSPTGPIRAGADLALREQRRRASRGVSYRSHSCWRRSHSSCTAAARRSARRSRYIVPGGQPRPQVRAKEGRRSDPAWTAAARGSRSTVPRGSVRVRIVPRFRLEGHSAVIYPRAGADLTPHGQRRRAGRGAQCRWGSVRGTIVPRFRLEGHSAVIYPAGPLRAGAVLTLHGQRRRAGRGAQCRGQQGRHDCAKVQV